jgi:MYXO-CTERM domain-containing protein
LTVSVGDGNATATRELSFTVRENANLLIVPNPLPNAQFGVPYSQQLEATGGLRPLTWLIEVGQLPEGLDLSTSGELSGTPMQVGTFRVIIEARDAGTPGRQAKDVNTFELVVEDVEGFTIETASLPDATVEEGYDESVRTMGGVAPISWSVTEGSLPDGLVGSVNTASNEFRIAGQPNAVGTSNLLLTATDSQGRVASRSFALRVLAKAPVLMETTDEGGCGCTATHSEDRASSAMFGALALLGLALLRRRK